MLEFTSKLESGREGVRWSLGWRWDTGPNSPLHSSPSALLHFSRAEQSTEGEEGEEEEVVAVEAVVAAE